MKHNPWYDFLYQLIALLLAVIIVHSIYLSIVRPNAESLLTEQQTQQQIDENYVAKQSLFIIIKDYEQEACFILALWVFAIMGLKAHLALRERRLLKRSLLEVPAGTSILPEDTRQYSRSLQALPEDEREFFIAAHIAYCPATLRFHSKHSRRFFCRKRSL